MSTLKSNFQELINRGLKDVEHLTGCERADLTMDYIKDEADEDHLTDMFLSLPSGMAKQLIISIFSSIYEKDKVMIIKLLGTDFLKEKFEEAYTDMEEDDQSDDYCYINDEC